MVATGFPSQIKSIDITFGLYELAHDSVEKYDIKGLYPDLIKAIMVHVEKPDKIWAMICLGVKVQTNFCQQKCISRF